jgi:hypothetical protein
MRFRWGKLLPPGLALLAARPGAAQQTWEAGIQSIGAFPLSRPAAIVAGGYGGWRGSERTRISAAGAVGIAGQKFAWRAEALVHFLFSPNEARRPGLYLAGGIAAAGGTSTRGYLVATLGLDQRPRARTGWAVEAGVGGGIRLAAGYRWRFLSGPGTK